MKEATPLLCSLLLLNRKGSGQRLEIMDYGCSCSQEGNTPNNTMTGTKALWLLPPSRTSAYLGGLWHCNMVFLNTKSRGSSGVRGGKAQSQRLLFPCRWDDALTAQQGVYRV